MFDPFNSIEGHPILQGVIFSAVMSFLRVVYDGKETRPARIALECGVAGGLAVVAGHAVIALGISVSWTLAVSGAIGFLGVNQIRKLAQYAIKRKIDKETQ